MTNILDKTERFYGRIAVLIFVIGCLFQGGIFLLPSFFMAGMFGLFFQERKRRKKETLMTACRNICVENTSIATHMSNATATDFSSSDNSYRTSLNHSQIEIGDHSYSWQSTDNTNHASNIDGSAMCGATDIHGNPYGVT